MGLEDGWRGIIMWRPGGFGGGRRECVEEVGCPGALGETEMRRFQNHWFN